MDRNTALEHIRRSARKHADDCDCTTCRAAAGDQAAFHEIYRELV